jgi:capsular polysaccharide transport system permease protein
MGVLILIHAVGKGASPYGDSASVFYATGLVPTLTFIYVSRFMALSLVMNKQMLNFPIVRIMDVLVGRAFLETIAACVTLTAMMAILWMFGQDPWPDNLEAAVSCYLATILLAFGVGTCVAMFSMFMPFLLTLYQLLAIVLYLSSGTMFVASHLPDQIAYPLSYNPLLQCVEWMRTAFYPTYSDKLVNKEYVIAFGVCALMIGLGTERFFRGKILEG